MEGFKMTEKQVEPIFELDPETVENGSLAEPVIHLDWRTSWTELLDLDTHEAPMLWDGLCHEMRSRFWQG
jgi:hypothetical protein